jgi:hypothetical protein
MKRPLALAAFLVFVALVSASAQRGGMRGSGGGHGIAMGHPSGGHAFSGMRGGQGVAPSFRGNGSFHGNGFGGVGFHNGGFHRCFGCRRGFGFPRYAGYGYGYGAYYPFWWSDSSSYNDDEEREQQIQGANQMNALNIQEQNLREREDWLREREEQDAYARRQPVREGEHAAPSPATVLVFRDQRRQEVTNYAIAGGTLWVLSDHIAAKKIPINELDLAATTRANDERGVEFQVPK